MHRLCTQPLRHSLAIWFSRCPQSWHFWMLLTFPYYYQPCTTNHSCSFHTNTKDMFNINPVCLSWSIHCSSCWRHCIRYVWTCCRHQVRGNPPLHGRAHGTQLNPQFHHCCGHKALLLALLRAPWIAPGSFARSTLAREDPIQTLLYLHSQDIAECTRRTLEVTTQLIDKHINLTLISLHDEPVVLIDGDS